MYTVNFAYNEPGIGSVDIDGEDTMTQDDVVKLIEEKYPSYVDIEVIGSDPVF